MRKLALSIGMALMSLAASAADACVPCYVVRVVKKIITVAQSYDPNEMAGPTGVGEQRYVTPGEPMDYTIYFENQTNATAAAIKIAVMLPKDANLDWSTLELGEVVFGDHTDTGFVDDKTARSIKYALADSGCEVHTTVTETDSDITWNLRIWDPTTSDHFPDDFNKGVLPPNDPETHCGEGHIAFRVNVKSDAAPNTRINASASIVFDDNPAIVTDPAWWNTVAPNVGTAAFSESVITVDEGSNTIVRVSGGSMGAASSVKVYLTYNTAAAADVDLKTASVGSYPSGLAATSPVSGEEFVVSATNLKFPITLNWAKGEVGEKVIMIPVKTDKAVEDDEFFTLQLADAQGMELGEDRVCTVTIHDMNDKTLKTTVTPYKPKAGEEVSTNSVTVTAGNEKGGFVSGTGEYTAGSKLTLTAEQRPGWSFVGWRLSSTGGSPVQGGDILSTKAKWQIVVTNDEEYVAVFEKIPYIRGLADPADGGKVSGSGLCARGKKVTLKATANKNFTFLGWATNSIAIDSIRQTPTAIDNLITTPSLVIDRTAKPAADSKTSTTITNVAEDVTYYAVFKSDPEIFVTVDATDGTGAEPTGKGAGKYVAGTITGMGKYAPGKKVTLKATANKGYVFAGWLDANGEPLTKDASYTIAAMGESDVEYTAKFVTADEDKASITLALAMGAEAEAFGLSTNEIVSVTNFCGVAMSWQLAAEALSATTIKVAGLPSGLKFTAKDILKKGSKTDVEVSANTIYGAPTTASKTDRNGNVTPSKVVFTVTTAGKSTQTFAIDLYIDPLPVWAVGTFDGVMGNGELGTGNGGSASAEATADERGTATLTIAANGKISGKLLRDDGTWTLAASAFDSVRRVADNAPYQGGATDEAIAFVATVIGKSGKLLETNEVTVSATEVELPGGYGLRGVANGSSLPSSLFPLPTSLSWKAYQNLWKRADTKEEMPVFKTDRKVDHWLGGQDDVSNMVTLTFKKEGVVSFAGKVGGASVSGTSQLVLVRRDEGTALCQVTLYAPPKGTFAGFRKTLAVTLTIEANIVTAVEVTAE